MKNQKRAIISVMLVMILLLTLLPTAAFAADGDEVYAEDFSSLDTGVLLSSPFSGTNVIIGDSIAAGYALPAYTGDDTVPQGSFAALASEHFGLEAVAHAHSGWRIADFLKLIGSSDEEIRSCIAASERFMHGDDLYFPAAVGEQTFFDWFFFSAMAANDADSLIAERENMKRDLAAADVITISFGSNDIFTEAMLRTLLDTASPLSSLLTEDAIPALINELLSLRSSEELLSKLLSLGGDAVSTIAYLFARCQDGVALYRERLPKLLSYLTDLNPEAQIYLLGVDIPLQINVHTDDGEFINLFPLAAIYSTQVDLFAMSLCDNFDTVTYTNAGGAEFYGLGQYDLSVISGGLSDAFQEFIRIVHPTPSGHRYIAEALIAAMEREIERPVITEAALNELSQPFIRWEEMDGAVSYRVYRSFSPDTGYTLVGATSKTCFIDLTAGSGSFYYRIIAVSDLKGTARSLASAPAAVTVKTNAVDIAKTAASLVLSAGSRLKGILHAFSR